LLHDDGSPEIDITEAFGARIATLDAAGRGCSDEELLAAIARGDHTSVALLYDRYQSQVYGFALNMLREPGAAQDVVQETFLAIWRSAGRYDASRAKPRTWIMTIVHRRAIDAIRRRRQADDLPTGDVLPRSLVTGDSWADVAQGLDRADLARALATLSPVQREAITLAYYGGLTQEEISVRTGAPLGTVKSRVRLALLALSGVLRSSTEQTHRITVTVPQAHSGSSPRL
jgi:RNA polymerase sigma-70 factor, ECF subfamily